MSTHWPMGSRNEYSVCGLFLPESEEAWSLAFEEVTCQKCKASMRADDLLAMLRELEWASWGYNGEDHGKQPGLEESCPSCRALKREDAGKHRTDCRLAALLRELP